MKVIILSKQITLLMNEHFNLRNVQWKMNESVVVDIMNKARRRTGA